MHTSTAMSEACNRTRQYVSLHLDGQLSELEAMMMESHLARCPACRSFTDELEGLTRALRGADLVEPPHRFELPHRPSRFSVNRVGATVAAALLVVAALGGIGSKPPGGQPADWQGTGLPSLDEHLALIAYRTPNAQTETPRGVEAAETTTIGLSQPQSPSPAGMPAEEW